MKKCAALILVFCLTGLIRVSAQDAAALKILIAAVEQQTARLQSSDFEIRRDAAQKLRLLEKPIAARAAAAVLNDKSEIVRATAAEAAAFLPDEEAAAALAPLLARDKSEFVRREAAFALGEARSKTAVFALIQALQNDKKPSVRAAATIALGKIGDARAVQPLTRILLLPDTKKNRKSVDEFVKRSAARSLGQIRDKSAVPVLIQTLRDTKNVDDIRREAAFALGAIADRSAVAALAENVNAADYLLAEIARNALRKIELSKVN